MAWKVLNKDSSYYTIIQIILKIHRFFKLFIRLLIVYNFIFMIITLFYFNDGFNEQFKLSKHLYICFTILLLIRIYLNYIMSRKK